MHSDHLKNVMMNNISLFLCLAGGLLSCGRSATDRATPGEPARPKTMVRVMAYNIYGARASSGR